MAISRRELYSSNARIVKNQNLKIDVNFDITTLDLMCSYIVSSNKNIRRSHIINMRNLFAISDMSNYNNDQERLNRIDFITKGIEARLKYNLTDCNMIKTQIGGGFGTNVEYQTKEVNNNEVDWINQTISETLKYSIIYNDVEIGLSLLTKFKATEFARRGPIVQEIHQWINGMQSKFRKASAEDVSDIKFSLVGDDYENSMRETYRKLASPANRLMFGSQALNALTGGGAESGRVYTFLGLPGEGKSATLLDLAIQLKRYNKNYQCKDKTKKPCIVLLTMENSVKETIERLFSMCTGGQSMLNYTEDQALDILRNEGQLMVTDDDPINIFVIYKPNLSVDTSYLYDLVEDLEDDGFETIAVLQDYLKRIRSAEGSFGGDLRLQYGAIINEYKVFATIKDIPLFTASQLNRDATKHIDEARQTNKGDLVRLIGRSNVGESNLILENSDWIALIAPEYDRDGNKFLGVQRVKSRYYIPGDFVYAYLPYVNGTIKLVEDYYSTMPIHRTTMREPIEMNNGGANINNNGVINSIREFTEYNDTKLIKDDSKNIFLNASTIVAHTIAIKQMQEMCYIVNKGAMG